MPAMTVGHGSYSTYPSGYLNKSLPQIVDIDSESAVPHSHHYQAPYTSGIVSKYDFARIVSDAQVQMPQFRESRNWQKTYGLHTIYVPPQSLQGRDSFLENNPTSEDVKSQQTSQRDISFEQQRAHGKRAIVQPELLATDTVPPDNPINATAHESNVGPGSTNHASAIDCWDIVKPAMKRLPRASAKVWPRKHSRNKKSSASSRPPDPPEPPAPAPAPQPVIISTPAENEPVQQEQVSEHNNSARKRAPTSTIRRKSIPALNRQSLNSAVGRARRKPTTSLTPTLHDPVKDITFSEECRNMLKSLGSENDWLLTTSIAPIHEASSTPNDTEIRMDAAKGETWKPPLTDLSETHAQLNAVIGSDEDVGPCHNPATTLLSTSTSKVPHEASTTSELPSQQIPAFSITINSMLSSHTPHISWEDDEQAVNRSKPLPTTPVVRLPSTRSILSTDTMTGIEASFHHSLRPSLQPTWNYLADSPASIDRYSGPPPTIPLPALPKEADDSQSERTRNGADMDSSAPSVDFTRHASRGPRADKVRARRLRDITNQRARPSEGDATKDKKALSPLLPAAVLTSPKAVQTVADELDRFPAVPETRPTSMSRRSTGSTHSHQQSPGKNKTPRLNRSSTASSARKVKTQHQILSQSRIFVVVDSDPHTARFRASTTSPTPSLGGNSPDRLSPSHAPAPSRLRDVVTTSEVSLLTSDGTEVSQNQRAGPTTNTMLSSPHQTPIKRGPARGDLEYHSSSSDEDAHLCPAPLIPKMTPPESTKRRRWNSGDIDLIRLLQRDLEDYYGMIREQEKKIEWQAQQMQMMTRVLMPMCRLRGVKFPPVLEESPVLAEVGPLRPPKRDSWSGSRRRSQQDVKSRAPLTIVEEKTLNPQGSEASRSRSGRSVSTVGPRNLDEVPSMRPGKPDLSSKTDCVQATEDGVASRYYRS